jgi:PadR family transcriptional regulator PadR
MLGMGPPDRSFAQLRRGVVEYCLLALLVREDRYGFDLVRSLSRSGLVAGEGTVYPLLTRLARDAYVTTTWRDSPSGPPRKYYAITARGKAALVQFQPEWTRFRDAVDGVFEEGAIEQ